MSDVVMAVAAVLFRLAMALHQPIRTVANRKEREARTSDRPVRLGRPMRQRFSTVPL
jgi:hypothetical protein